jgi:hypothetical protein
MAGEVSRARAAAKSALQAAPGMALAERQARLLAAVDGDWKVVTGLLDTEARAAATPEGRAHAAYLCSEVHRLVLRDAPSAERKLAQCAQASPGDPRAFVSRLCDQLAASAAAPKIKTVKKAARSATKDALKAASRKLKKAAKAI